MDWCSVYLTPQALPKYIYLSLPLIFPTTYNGIRTKKHPVWITPGAAPKRWMGPIRNPHWEQKRTEGYVIVSRCPWYRVWVYGVYCHFQQYFHCIVPVSLLVEETIVPRENHWPVASHWQTFITQGFIEYTSPWTRCELTTLVATGTDCTGSRLWCKLGTTSIYINIYAGT